MHTRETQAQNTSAARSGSKNALKWLQIENEVTYRDVMNALENKPNCAAPRFTTWAGRGGTIRVRPCPSNSRRNRCWRYGLSEKPPASRMNLIGLPMAAASASSLRMCSRVLLMIGSNSCCITCFGSISTPRRVRFSCWSSALHPFSPFMRSIAAATRAGPSPPSTCSIPVKSTRAPS